MNYFITTTLPYANSVPHVGHLLEFVQADCITRYLKSAGHNVFFNTGLDEHGLKIQRAAECAEIHPEKYVDNLRFKWLDFCKKFNISWDNWYSTSNRGHGILVSKFWNIIKEKGLIYKKQYTGYYCVGCECFKTTKYCTDHACELEEVSEENYFFNLSSLKEDVKLITADLLNNLSRQTEIANIIYGLDEISISRPRDKVKWGIPVPNDENHTIYVWFDALLNYIISAPNWNNSMNIQLCGPDNLKFQGYILQAFLAALEYKFTDRLLVHGTILDRYGIKMSKSKGNVIDPIEQLNKYGVDAVRWYILTQSTFNDFYWNENVLKDKWNELTNKWGNLISRVLTLVEKCGTEIDPDEKYYLEIDKNWDNFNLQGVTETIIGLIQQTNKEIEDLKVWETQDTKEIGRLYEQLKTINNLLIPFIPAKCAEVKSAIENKKKAILFKRL